MDNASYSWFTTFCFEFAVDKIMNLFSMERVFYIYFDRFFSIRTIVGTDIKHSLQTKLDNTKDFIKRDIRYIYFVFECVHL